MYTHNAKISVHQAKLLLVLQMFNMSIIILPRIAAKTAGHDGYMLPIAAFILGSIYIGVIVSLVNRFPGKDIVEFAPKIVGIPIAVVINTIFAIKLLISAGFELRMFAEMISQVLLPNTPLAVIILVMLFTVYYLIKSGAEASGRMAEVLMYFVFVPLVMILILIVIKTDYKQLLPMFQSEPKDFLSGAYYVSLTFVPLEFLLVLGAIVNKPSKMKGICFFAIGVTSVLEILIIGLTFTGIGTVETTRQIWPVLTLMQSVQLPGSFVENQEILMMVWWVLSIYMYVSGGIFVASQILSRLAKFQRENVTVIPLIPIVFFIAMAPGSLVEAYQYFIKFQGIYGIVFLLIVPAVLLCVAKLRKVGGTGE
ncbi:MAG: endospore germination permease [Cellulosilyticaceae bacterium]